MLGFDPAALEADTISIGGDLRVRRLGFGAMRLTGPGVWGKPNDVKSARALLRRVVESGINLIDTADAYGPNVDEEMIADALFPYPTDLVIATKGGSTRGGPGQWGADGHPRHLRKACEGSLSRLRMTCIDLYQLHTVDPRIPIEESVGALVELQAEGKIRHIGLSNVSVAQLKRASAIARIVSVQNRYNLIDRSSEDVLTECERSDIAFIPWFPLATGSLATAGGVVATIAANHEATSAQVALAWLIHRSRVMMPIPGTSSLAHFEENLGGMNVRLSKSDFTNLVDAKF